MRAYRSTPDYISWTRYQRKRGRCRFSLQLILLSSTLNHLLTCLWCGFSSIQFINAPPHSPLSFFYVCHIKTSLSHHSSSSFQIDYEKSLKVYHNTPAYLAYMSAKSKKSGMQFSVTPFACFYVLIVCTMTVCVKTLIYVDFPSLQEQMETVTIRQGRARKVSRIAVSTFNQPKTKKIRTTATRSSRSRMLATCAIIV